MQKACTNCSIPFGVTEADLTFYEKISPRFGGKSFPLPPPTLCPDCRNMRRLAFRNERCLYRRTCDLTGKPLLSIYNTDVSFPVYSYDAWWSDDWDALSYGREFDPARPFFEQFEKLFRCVPRLGIVTGHNENCDYCNYTNYSKSSYLCFGCHTVDHCFHNWRTHWCEHCVDCLQLNKCTLCYECIDCDECYNLRFSQDCSTCSDSAFLYDCRGCTHCVGCVGLRNREYSLFNEQLNEKTYAQKMKQLQLHTPDGIEKTQMKFKEFKQEKPHRNLFIFNSENANGDHIFDSHNLRECYHVKRAEDCSYLESCEDIRDSMDSSFSGWPAELVYETMSAGVTCYNFLFCTASWSCSNLIYCDNCHHSSNLFGCIGLRKKNQYCILNKQCTKEEYEELVPKVIAHMQSTREWGQFFPQYLSPHAYNETIAYGYYPLTETEVNSRGWGWREETDEMPKMEKVIPGDSLPETIDQTPEDVLNWAILCKISTRPFKIIKQELEFYRQMQLPLPRLHPDERYRRRMACRNPRKLWRRKCSKCGKEMETTYGPERPEIVYCEECYLAAVY